ncbi:hypothetical protein [Nocardia sp. BMG51109]|uniref:hypothetical protein n=1 Tax=Nocardia sp. BMG51109 TaxID=1056816 RepID=UPI0004657E56|nr:hypothetical protein [Nocardia sp. BMG51109]
MRGKGMTYDTGFIRGGDTSRKLFDRETVARELAIIRDDLHCNAVQITGGDPDRLDLAAACAAELGLEIWYSPYPLESTPGEILALFADCAARAERFRESGAEVVFVAGVELSLMNRGFLPGDTVPDRLDGLLNADDRQERITEMRTRLDDFLAEAVAVVRARFGGRITYACVPLENVDWAPFDIMSVELIRSAQVADHYQEGVRSLVARGKPVAITGFGAATWRGAGDAGARGMEIAEYSDTGAPIRLNGNYIRDEEGQARCLREVLEIFEAEGVDSAFVFLFALYDFPHRPDGDPRDDLDLAGFGIVKVLEGRHGETYPDMPWEPKAAFTAVAEHYRDHPAP